MELGWHLPPILDAHGKRALEVPSRIGNGLSNLAFDNSVLRRVPHLELSARNFRGGDDFKIGKRHEVPDFQLACIQWLMLASLHDQLQSLFARLVPE
jgi:hypothetical protein